MTCLPEELFAAAMNVHKIADGEPMYRAVVNRAYYAAYHCCRLYHAGLPHLGTLSGKGVHEQLIAQLQFPSAKLTENGRARSVTIGKYLRQACTARALADYIMDKEFDLAQMDSTVLIVESLFEGVKVKKGLIE